MTRYRKLSIAFATICTMSVIGLIPIGSAVATAQQGTFDVAGIVGMVYRGEISSADLYQAAESIDSPAGHSQLIECAEIASRWEASIVAVQKMLPEHNFSALNAKQWQIVEGAMHGDCTSYDIYQLANSVSDRQVMSELLECARYAEEWEGRLQALYEMATWLEVYSAGGNMPGDYAGNGGNYERGDAYWQSETERLKRENDWSAMSGASISTSPEGSVMYNNSSSGTSAVYIPGMGVSVSTPAMAEPW